jgi:lipid-binding SYLF domain-containing protein
VSDTSRHWVTRVRACSMAAVVLIALVATSAQLVLADDAQDARQLVEKARLTLQEFLADPQMGPALQSLLSKARAVLIYPQVLRGAFIIGVSGGSGVLLARNMSTNQWGGPAFYTIGQASFGLQAGGDASEVVLVALTNRGISSLLATSAKLGGDASVALGPVGWGAQAATQNLSADIVSYSLSKGLYAGLSLDGAVVAVRDSLNSAYYGKVVTPTQILIQQDISNLQAAGLLEDVAKAAGAK